MKNLKKLWLVVIGLVVVASIIGLAGCGSSSTPAASQQLQTTVTSQQQGIWVSAEGKVEAEPDIAILTLGVQAQAQNAQDAQSQASQAMDGVIKVLKAQGIADADIQTQYYNISQQTKYNPTTGEQTVTGYQVTNTVTVKVRDITKTGDVIDAVVASAGNLVRINNVSFDISDPSQYQAQARELALKAAQAKAQQIASVTGVTLGKITYITENSNTPAPIYRTFAAADTAAPVPTTSINPGQIEVTSNVQIAYGIGN